MFSPHENEINFDPAVRLPQMEAEQYTYTRPMIARISTTRELYDRALEQSARALRIRNIEGGCGAVAFMGMTLSHRVLHHDIIPSSGAWALISGAAVGLLVMEASDHHNKAKQKQTDATRFAAYEAEEAQWAERPVPDWAAFRLQQVGKTASEVLDPPKR